jgi:hypothetical protein
MKHFEYEKRKRTQSNRNYLRLCVQNEMKHPDGAEWSFDKFSRVWPSWRKFH